MPSMPSGRLVVISGPSGAGKTTLLKRVLADNQPRLRHSVSATTRRPRPGEIDGVDYHFLAPEEFERRRKNGEFLECFEVYGRGYWYGTLLEEVAPSLEQGKWVVLEIDIQGAQAVLKRFPDALTIFVSPGSREELERRLRGRGTETDANLARRLQVAERELECADWYQHRVVNDEIDRAAGEIGDILIRGGIQQV